MSNQTIALIDGAGSMGTLIANALLDKPDVQLRLLARTQRVSNCLLCQESQGVFFRLPLKNRRTQLV